VSSVWNSEELKSRKAENMSARNRGFQKTDKDMAFLALYLEHSREASNEKNPHAVLIANFGEPEQAVPSMTISTFWKRGGAKERRTFCIHQGLLVNRESHAIQLLLLDDRKEAPNEKIPHILNGMNFREPESSAIRAFGWILGRRSRRAEDMLLENVGFEKSRTFWSLPLGWKEEERGAKSTLVECHELLESRKQVPSNMIAWSLKKEEQESMASIMVYFEKQTKAIVVSSHALKKEVVNKRGTLSQSFLSSGSSETAMHILVWYLRKGQRRASVHPWCTSKSKERPSPCLSTLEWKKQKTGGGHFGIIWPFEKQRKSHPGAPADFSKGGGRNPHSKPIWQLWEIENPAMGVLNVLFRTSHIWWQSQGEARSHVRFVLRFSQRAENSCTVLLGALGGREEAIQVSGVDLRRRRREKRRRNSMVRLSHSFSWGIEASHVCPQWHVKNRHIRWLCHVSKGGARSHDMRSAVLRRTRSSCVRPRWLLGGGGRNSKKFACCFEKGKKRAMRMPVSVF
jgi:hypothetical protein